jgi:RNA polymerase primary sigma factor
VRSAVVRLDLLDRPSLNDDRLAAKSADPLPIYLKDMSAVPLLGAGRERELFERLERAKAGLRELAEALPESYRPVLAAEAADSLADVERVHESFERYRRECPEQPDTESLRRARNYRRELDSIKEELVLANLRLVVHIAKRYSSHGVALLDLIQEGNIGLMRAIGKFEYARGNKLSTYAHWWIKQAIVRCIADKSRVIRLPVHLHERRRKINQVSGQLSQRLGRRPEPMEIAHKLHVSLDAVEKVLGTIPDAVALEDTGEEDRGRSAIQTVEDPRAISPWLHLARRDLSAKVDEILKALPEREERVLRLRFGIGGQNAYTLDQIGEMIHVSRERVRQIQAAAIRRLQDSEALDDFRRFAGTV